MIDDIDGAPANTANTGIDVPGSKVDDAVEGIGKVEGASKTVEGLGSKTEGYIAKRGWTMDTMNDVVGNPYTTREAFNKATGNSATVYYNKVGDYVVVDDITGELVQTSKFGDTGWIPDATIKNPYKP